MSANGLKIAVGIATSGRPAILHETLREIANQTIRPDVLFVCPAAPDDFDAIGAAGFGLPIQAVTSARGLPAQRNAILAQARGYDIMVFFDDDFFPSVDYISEIGKLFSANPDIAVATGLVIADGITGPGIGISEARALLASHVLRTGDITACHNAYGCNMIIRLDPVHRNNIRFDEELPLYGWLEDVDFCRQMVKAGRIVRASCLTGVHLGAKSGRTSGLRFGYSQIANPLYIWRKGSTSAGWATYHIAKNILANLYHCARPEPWVDRRGRLYGNWLATRDLFQRKLHPRRILAFN